MPDAQPLGVGARHLADCRGRMLGCVNIHVHFLDCSDSLLSDLPFEPESGVRSTRPAIFGSTARPPAGCDGPLSGRGPADYRGLTNNPYAGAWCGSRIFFPV